MDDLYMERIGVPRDSFATEGAEKKLTVELRTSEDERRFVLVANSPNHVLQLQEGVTKVKDLLPQLTFSSQSADYMHWKISPTYFPMWGETGLYETLPSPITVEMKRSVVKVEVGIDINNSAGGDNAIGFGSVFEIDSVFLCNVNDSGYIAPSAGQIATPKLNIGYKFEKNTSSRLMTNTIYAPATNTMIIESGDTIHRPPYLILKAKYYDNDRFYYYRIDFVNEGNYRPLLHNQNYTVNITGIRTVGYSSLTEAQNAPILPINPNLILGDETATATINDVIYNDKYWLGCQATDIKADWNVTTAKIKVGTSYPDGCRIERLSFSGETGREGYSWAPASPSISDGYLSVDLEGENYSGKPRTIKLKLSAGTLTQYITVTQSPGSHTYVVKVGTGISIPLKSANMDGADRLSNAIKTAVCYYQGESESFLASPHTSSNIHTGQTDTVKIGIGSTRVNKEGKMIVTIRKNSSQNEVLFTWTVWVVSNDVDFETSGNQRYYNGYTFMDRNLGASTIEDVGLYYQWGRKDPVAEIAKRELISVPPLVNQTEVVDSVFYLAGTYPYDWIKIQNNNLWTTIDGEKGIYDPCPFGWRVPPAENNEASPWQGFTDGKNTLRIPSGGGISGDTGASITSGKFVWGASARGIDAYVYDASGSHLQAHRTNAYPIRCIRDVKRPEGSLIVVKQ
ncbi:MAG: hypothetical protein LBD89_02925 [Tannerellaceae bacterium]|nr:hypothetical protein [Tannerellaceae bacterium]